MTHFREHWFPYLIGLVVCIVLLSTQYGETRPVQVLPASFSFIPDISELTGSEEDQMILYGKDLIDHTSYYFGPEGKIKPVTNGIECANCHRESGTKLFTNNFLAVATTYPKFRPRSGKIESVEFRVNECMQRSLAGFPIENESKEMKAMVAYIKWTGKNVDPDHKLEGVGSQNIPTIPRAADPFAGKEIFRLKCSSCHGANGEGQRSYSATAYIYPPLWGEHSYAMSAGMYRNSVLASFIKYNMPPGANYYSSAVTNEEAWDLAAFINSQPHPDKKFSYDWPNIALKPFDYPFGPYTDGFSEKQHKYGPYKQIKKAKP